jgi:hypothetical protein
MQNGQVGARGGPAALPLAWGEGWGEGRELAGEGTPLTLSLSQRERGPAPGWFRLGSTPLQRRS